MKNIEDLYAEKIDIARAYEQAKSVLAQEAIQPRQFVDLYGEETVNRDEEYVRKLEAKFKKSTPEETVMLATILEATFHQNVKLNEWLGPNVRLIKPSRYDDIVNGVDDIAEFQTGEAQAQYLAIAIDITFSPYKETVFERIKQEIKEGSLARIKYFSSEHVGIRGELRNIPRVVIGADIRTVRELSDLWLEKDNQRLANHPIQFQILEEIILQLRTFEAYATKVNQPTVAASYRRIRGLLEQVYKEKQKKLGDPGTRDSVFEAIRAKLKYF